MRIWPILLLLSLGLCVPGLAQTVVLEGQSSDFFAERANGVLVHEASGFKFPASLGEMPRRKRVLYAANNVSVQYTLRGGGNGDAWIDVFVYPATLSLDEEAQNTAAAIMSGVNGKRAAAPLTLPPGAANAKAAWFEGEAGDRRMTTGFVLVRRGDWYIKVRATNPTEGGEGGIKRIQGALSDLPWDWRPVEQTI